MVNRIALLGKALGCATLLGLSSACAGAAPPPDSPERERVQVGYGSQDREDVTGSISSITAEEIRGTPSGRLEEVLKYRVPGLDVVRTRNGEYSLRVRGMRSLITTNEPLVVIDGMPAMGRNAMDALSLVSPQTVERIDVLKDAGALAAFGSRGVNGVILITTKRGP